MIPSKASRTNFHLISLFSSGWTCSTCLLTRERIKTQCQEARLTSPSPLHLLANPQNGCLVSWDTNQLQEWDQPCEAWRGHDPSRLHRSRRGCWDLVAMPIQDREVVTITPTTPSWWEWAASWEHAKCRTSATGSISSLVRVAEKTHPPSTPGAPIVMDELADAFKNPQQVYLYNHLFISMCYW